MRPKIHLTLILLTLIVIVIPLAAQAAVVGHFTQIRGQVDLLKEGKLPAVAAKVQDGVEPGDVVRTKSKSKAQLTMVDDSVITMAPDSRLAIADYQYEPTRQERRAVVRIFRGLVQTVVKHIVRREQPDFVIETHTATIGVRGSNPYFLLLPSFTSVYLPQGLLEAKSNNPDIPFQVTLRDMQFTQIRQNQQPMLPQPLTAEMLHLLGQMMNTGITPGFSWGGPAGSSSGATGAVGADFLFKSTISPEQKIMQQTIPPTVPPPATMPPPAQPSHPSGSGSYSPPMGS